MAEPLSPRLPHGVKLKKSTKVAVFGIAVLACVAYGLEQNRKSNAFYAERNTLDLKFNEAYTAIALGIPGALQRAEELANQGSDRANARLASYYRVNEMNAATTPATDGKEGALNLQAVDFSKSTSFIMDRLTYLTDLDLASFLNVSQPIFSEEGRAGYIKHCQAKGCSPAYQERALASGLSTEQQAQLSDCFNKIKWKLDSKYQVMFNYDAKGACAPAGKS